MARVTTVQRARKSPGTCGWCGTAIEAGQPYRWTQPGFRGRKLVRCAKPECQFRQSHLTTSKMQDAYAAFEDLEDVLDDKAAGTDDIWAQVQDTSDRWRAVADEYQEAADAWGDGMAEPPAEWTERIDEVNAAADELENVEEPQEDDEDFDAEEWRDEVRSVLEGVMLP